MDIVAARTQLVDHLEGLGFLQYGAEPSDFAREDHPIRFKLGTTGAEVTLSAWTSTGQVEIQRITRESQVPDLIQMISSYNRLVA